MRGEYFFVRRSKRGPRLPRRASFCEVADPGKGCPWALYRCDPPKRKTPFVAPTSDTLATLLRSGEGYPPAMALARIDVARSFRGRRATRAEFARFYERRLRYHLLRQSDAQAVLAESMTDDGVYRSRGQFCWVLPRKPHFGDLAWVSESDYFVYSARVSEFRLSRSWSRRFKQLCRPPAR